jgi:thiol:disulfide interchange protein DsbD
MDQAQHCRNLFTEVPMPAFLKILLLSLFTALPLVVVYAQVQPQEGSAVVSTGVTGVTGVTGAEERVAAAVPLIEASLSRTNDTLSVRILIPGGTYAYLDSPDSRPVRIAPGPDGTFRLEPVSSPAGYRKGAETLLKGDVEFVYRIIETGSSGRQTLTIDYQLCDEALGQCYMPQRLLFDLDGGAAVGASVEAVPEGDALSLGERLRGVLSANMDNPLYAFLLAMLGGLLASLTPCVYPVIPVTVGYFAKRAAEGRGNRVGGAFAYVGGMGMVYTALGLIAGLAGSAFGELTNRPGFFIGIGVVFFLLALSLFDVFEIRVPQFLKRSGGSARGGGGAFLMGAATGLVASPCVGPIVFFLLTGVLSSGQPLYGALLMAGFSVGMGIPFLGLALSAGRLPRSGNFMVRIKLVFGALVLASSFYFLELALRGWALPAAAVLAVAVAGCLAAAFLGFRKVSGLYGNSGGHRVFLLVLTGLVLVFTLATLDGGGDALGWSDDLDAALAASVRDGRPVFLDLHADWCAVCRELEHELVKRPALVKRLEETFHAVRMDFDRNREMLRSRYAVQSLPWVLVLSSLGEVLWKRVGFDDAARFADELESVVRRFSVKRD